jgi:hypothetical protein
MKWIYIVAISLLFNGCDLLESQESQIKKIELQKKAFEKRVADEKDIQLKKLSAQTQKELAILESKKELALIEKAKELEKIRMQAELEKQKILFEKEKQEALFTQEMKQQEQAYSMELKRYLSITLALFLFLVSFFIFYYFKKRREDKLRAYNDNLEKYFHHKENEARVKIAEKMLDTIGSGHLDKTQENQLISAFSGAATGTYQKQLSETQEEIVEVEESVIEVIEDKTTKE